MSSEIFGVAASFDRHGPAGQPGRAGLLPSPRSKCHSPAGCWIRRNRPTSNFSQDGGAVSRPASRTGSSSCITHAARTICRPIHKIAFLADTINSRSLELSRLSISHNFDVKTGGEAWSQNLIIFRCHRAAALPLEEVDWARSFVRSFIVFVQQIGGSWLVGSLASCRYAIARIGHSLAAQPNPSCCCCCNIKRRGVYPVGRPRHAGRLASQNVRVSTYVRVT